MGCRTRFFVGCFGTWTLCYKRGASLALTWPAVSGLLTPEKALCEWGPLPPLVPDHKPPVLVSILLRASIGVAGEGGTGAYNKKYG